MLKEIQVIRKELQNNWSEDASSAAPNPIDKNRALQDFQKETRVLRFLRHTKNPYIVDILGSYVFRNVYNIFFPLADMDLEDFLQGKQGIVFDHGEEVFEQLYGLATALNEMHSYRLLEQDLELLGCHHDLKPNNILIFGRTWTLADFGLSRLVPINEGSKTRFKDCIGDYFAPECLDGEWSQQKIGRASDIWSFGCVISEVITFSVFGSEGVAEFRSSRETEGRPRHLNSWFHSMGKMKVEVDAWLLKLERSIKDDASKALIALVRDMLNEQPHHRPNANAVQLNLNSIALTSLAQRAYKLFADLVEHHTSLELQFENLRFKEWCNALGLVSPSSSQAISRDENLLDIYPKIRDHLRAICELALKSSVLGHEVGEANDNSVEQLHLNLRDRNDMLRTTLPPKLKEDIQARWRSRRLQTENTADLEYLENNADNEVASLARMRRLMLLMEQNKLDGEQLNLNADDIFDVHSFGKHSTAKLLPPAEAGKEVEERHVLVEWWAVQNWDLSNDDELFVRMGAIAALPNVPDRPHSFRVLESEGFFWDKRESRFGIVYAMPHPPVAGSCPSPVTLRTVIERNQSSSRLDRPLLGDRFALAYNLCLCVYEFHAVGWIHHKLNIDNVIFFPPPDKKVTATETIQNPYIIGFNHSRPLDNSNCSIEPKSTELKNVHQHPDYLANNNNDNGSRFTRAFDCYSLGVILLQIGLWYDVELLDSGVIRRSDRWEQHQEVLRIAQRLGVYMGEVYRDVVLFCLRDLRQEEIKAEMLAKRNSQERANMVHSFDDSYGFSTMDDLFQRHVLSPLSDCHI